MTDELKQAALSLVDCYRPFENCDEHRLKEAISTVSRFCSYAFGPDEIAEMLDEIKQIQISRHRRAVEGPSFISNERVIVVEDIPWWNKATSAKPEAGIVGVVLSPSVPIKSQFDKNRYSYEGLVPVRFHSTDLGYEWSEGDDPDWEYITYNMPNYTLESVR